LFFVDLQAALQGRMELPDKLAPTSGEAWHVLAPVPGVQTEGLYYIAAFATDNFSDNGSGDGFQQGHVDNSFFHRVVWIITPCPLP
ncbi:MAG TPA: hypothetical protein PKC46_15100, partial [Sphingorhabdus sp.]|nr:hypothetical protein [Sphingorhabdus sp.]